ncbi:hypothetical protein GKZ89_08345 [Bacillus mangrovi]|uniref:Phospholipase/carboxylesterase/thioesterase domain-containing protein n=1 Tax=Metabacillus mangrovi TaxID=1491830 RepID=A0A7X2S545_9BACI|nr:dienelactone hydrolase family protein [Metabacillus mangrovi]MTH53425.1 hypothetical protein [Metabacillus mangrovi]
MFYQTERKLISLFMEKEWDEAYALVLKAESEYPNKLHKTSFWKACLQCINHETGDAMETLQKAYDKGFWWNPDLLKGDSDLDPLRDKKAFQQLVEECEERREQAKKEAVPLVEFHGKQDPEEAIVVLHGRGGNMEDTIPYWMNELSIRNYLFAFPQSSQMAGYEAFCWDDEERATDEISGVLKKIKNNFPDIKRIILAGYSQGGKLALKLVLNGEFEETKEFFAVVPAIREDEVQLSAKSGTSGWLVAGKDDPFYEDTKKLKKKLDEQKIQCNWLEYGELGHTYPENFSDQLSDALKKSM